MTRRTLLSAAAAPLVSAQSTRGRNVLIMVADDLGLHTGAYGDPTAKTPNLDRLAASGVRFANAFCTTASCSASRSVIFSGLHNHANGQYGHAHAEHHFAYLPHVKPMPRLLKDAGYATALFGKFHVNPPSAFAWDVLQEGDQRNVKGLADKAAAFIRSTGSKPWLTYIGFGDPHRAGRGFANEKEHPGVTTTPFDPARIAVPPFLPDTSEVRKEVAEYYQAANRMDQGVGMMLEALRAAGQFDNTLIIFLSDNGMPFPNAKTNVYDAGARLPLIVRSPTQTKRGVVNQALASWVDIAPTVLDWAGAKGPDYPLHGRSLLPILEEEQPAAWDKAYLSHTYHEITMYYPMRGVRTRRYKYIRNLFPELEFPHASDLWASETWQSVLRKGPSAMVGRRPAEAYLHRAPEELYDITSDPLEVKNLATDPQHAAVLKQLRDDVDAYRRKTGDPWVINDNYKAGVRK